jgi:hypothetical protein
MEDSVKLTDTQLRLLAAASRRDNLTGGAPGKVVAKLLAEGPVEENRSRGALPLWCRDGDAAHTSASPGEAFRRSRSTTRLTNCQRSRPHGRRKRASPLRHPDIRFQAGQRDYDVELPAGDDHRRNHERDRVATAFRARLLRSARSWD